METYCLLVVGLLQDGDEEVRNDMADSIGTLLSSLSSYVGMCIHVLYTQCVYVCYIPYVYTCVIYPMCIRVLYTLCATDVLYTQCATVQNEKH